MYPLRGLKTHLIAPKNNASHDVYTLPHRARELGEGWFVRSLSPRAPPHLSYVSVISGSSNLNPHIQHILDVEDDVVIQLQRETRRNV